MTITAKTFVILYSAQQECFHIETIGDMLKRGRTSFLDERPNQYFPLAFAVSHEQAVENVKKLKLMKKNYYLPEHLTIISDNDL